MQVSPVVHFRTGVATHPVTYDTNPIFPNPSNRYNELTHDTIFELTNLITETKVYIAFYNRINSPH